MKVINELELLLECLQRWKNKPNLREFENQYVAKLLVWIKPLLSDFSRFSQSENVLYESLLRLDWKTYRETALTISPVDEENRLRKHINSIEKLLGVPLNGEALLFGAFACMDGYARFNKGVHRVFLGIDESHHEPTYLDVLLTHELTHVARESRLSVWEGFGLDLSMNHDEFSIKLPLIEHLMNEGFSCVVSELLNPGLHPWQYVYQNKASFAEVIHNKEYIDKKVHQMLKSGEHFHSLYDIKSYGAPKPLPRFSHYTWAWLWVRQLLEEVGKGDPKNLLGLCSKDLVNHALQFCLPSDSLPTPLQ